MTSILRIVSFFILFLSATAARAGVVYNRRAAGLTGDSNCVNYLCLNATSDGTNVQYIVASTGLAKTTGWLAIGFGTVMSDSSMVILWTNSDGTVTLSQRTASGEVMPTVSTPSRVATLVPALTQATGSTPQFAFTMPVTSDTTQRIIWAISDQTPTSSAADATIAQHLGEGFGQFSLDLTKTVAAAPAPSSSAETPATSSTPAPVSSTADASSVAPTSTQISSSAPSPSASPSSSAAAATPSKISGACRAKGYAKRAMIKRSWSPVPFA